jgi:hypothetical protein
LLRSHHTVEHADDIPVRHGLYLRPNCQPRLRDCWVCVLDDGIVAVARVADLIDHGGDWILLVDGFLGAPTGDGQSCS